MISNIRIKKIATYKSEQKLENLKKFNYFFGANGTGKTTISSIIASSTSLDKSPFNECSIKWLNDNQLETRVYNRCFVDENFGEQLKGVFTLGKESKEAKEEIEKKKEELNNIQECIDKLKNTLVGADGKSGKCKDLFNLEEKYKTIFWNQKIKADDSPIQKGMQGVLNNQQKFKDKVLENLSNDSALVPLSELENKAKTVFNEGLMKVNEFLIPDISKLEQLENDIILKKIIVGKADVDIAAMIKSLGNSDWVKQGKTYFESNNSICPFCQQKVGETFSQSLEDYFDKTFEEETSKIANLINDYNSQSEKIVESVQIVIGNENAGKFLDIKQLEEKKRTFEGLVKINKQKLDKKSKEASQIIKLEHTKNILKEIQQIITDANANISENNVIAQNIGNERKDLIKKIWRYVVNELQANIIAYKAEKQNLEAAISNLNTKINDNKNIIKERKDEIRNLEKLITSIQPTCDGINKLLSSFGFNSFRLAVADDGKSYKMLREDGTDAQNTLSEGERNFVTFLYYYHLLRGSHSESEITSNKVVVIDDPVSSLDNDVLFIVSTLVREIIAQVRNTGSDIKQVFVLTHNIYFHKEITFNTKRKDKALCEETFFIVKKRDNESIIEKMNHNPIKTSYELLWEEIADVDCNKATIQNTMRRVLENYFKMLGSINLDQLYNKFNGDDKLKCKALLSWINDGSHSALDEDYYTPLSDTEVLKFKDVFKQIFEVSGHIEHYKMMVKSDIDLAQEDIG